MTDALLCRLPTVCSSRAPVQCPDGSCQTSADHCTVAKTCPASQPVLCPDGFCATSVATCGAAPPLCPADMPVHCPAGGCRIRREDCPAAVACPPDSPLRCVDGTCGRAPNNCTDLALLGCANGLVRCPGGECATSFALCPTHISCSAGMTRCWDGTCEKDCSQVVIQPVCAPNQVVCPQAAQGTACADSFDQCPTFSVCPRRTPVRCSDQTCAVTIDDCPPPTTYSAVKFACPNGNWNNKLSLCSTAVTCPPNLPLKCWDETCRVVPEDCPPTINCGSATPFLCPGGQCVTNLWNCPDSGQPCADPTPVKCFAYSNGFCAINNTLCADMTVVDISQLRNTCPDNGVRCKDGTCVASLAYCSVGCPQYLSFQCPDGHCARTEAECPQNGGCPWDRPNKCKDGKCVADPTLCAVDPAHCTGQAACPDGSCSASTNTCPFITGCTTNQDWCWDKSCQQSGPVSLCITPDITANGCPPNRPFRCLDGFCALSSTSCPLIPSQLPISASIPANVSCEQTAIGGVRPFR